MLFFGIFLDLLHIFDNLILREGRGDHDDVGIGSNSIIRVVVVL